MTRAPPHHHLTRPTTATPATTPATAAAGRRSTTTAIAVAAVLITSVLLPAAAPAEGPPGDVTWLDVHLDAVAPHRAGAQLSTAGTVQLTAAAGPIPGLAGPVMLWATTGPEATCEVTPTALMLDPVSGAAPFELVCTVDRPGNHTITVSARSSPHRDGHADLVLQVLPDTLHGTIELGPVDGFQAPLTLRVWPEHLPSAAVNATLVAELEGTTLSFTVPLGASVAGPTGVIDHDFVARHGPGTYQLIVSADGPRVEPLVLNATLTFASPPPDDEHRFNVTVLPAEPHVALADDPVNADGKGKRPGDPLITRLETQNAETLNVTVYHVRNGDPILLDQQALEPAADGSVEHAFTHEQLPLGPLVVVAQAGNATATRTGEVLQAATTLTVNGTTTVLGDGRPLALNVTVADDNLGSTPLDPGPVTALPDLTWKVFRGSLTVNGWTSHLGPYTGTGIGTAPTSEVTWPNGTSWATVANGTAILPLVLDPSEGVAAGSYRVSLYDAGGNRLGGTDLTLAPPPTFALDAGPPIPGDDLPITVHVTDPVPNTSLALRLDVPGHPPTEVHHVVPTPPAGTDPGAVVQVNTTVHLPGPLPAGTTVQLQAWATWPGRPNASAADAELALDALAAPPRISTSAALDGAPARAPLPLHPAAAHQVQLVYDVVDPNGDAFVVNATVLDPTGATVDWPLTHEGPARPVVTLDVPAGAAPGRYLLRLVAEDPDGISTADVPLDVAPVTRVGLDGPAELAHHRGGVTVVPVSVQNTGTTSIEGLAVTAELPDGLTLVVRTAGGTVPLDTIVPRTLGPGEGVLLELELTGAPPVGQAPARIVVAGVVAASGGGST